MADDPSAVPTTALPEDNGERGPEQRLWIRIPNPHTTMLLGRHHEGDEAFGHSGITFETAKSAYWNVMQMVHMQSGGDFSMTTGSNMASHAHGVWKVESGTATVSTRGTTIISAGTGGDDDPKENKGGTFEVVKNYYEKFQKLTELHEQGFSNYQSIVGIAFGVKSLLGFSWDKAPGLMATLNKNKGNLFSAVMALKDIATNAAKINKKEDEQPSLTMQGEAGITMMSPKEIVALANGGYKVVTGLMSNFEVLTFGADIKGIKAVEFFGGYSAAIEAGYKLEMSAAGPAGLSSKMSSVEIIGKKVEIGSQTPVSKYMGWNPAKQKPTDEISMKAVKEIVANSQDKIELKADKKIEGEAEEELKLKVKESAVEMKPEEIVIKHKNLPRIALNDERILAATGSQNFVKIHKSDGVSIRHQGEKVDFKPSQFTIQCTSIINIKASTVIKIG